MPSRLVARSAERDALVPVEADGVRILVADANALTRFGIRRALEEHGFFVCAEAADASEAVEAAVRERPDICLLDLHMPGDKIAAIAAIAAELPATAVVMLTPSRDDDLFDALCAGASGYLPKDIDPSGFPVTLRRVLEGEVALPRAVLTRLVQEFQERGKKRHLPLLQERGVKLTSREWEVLELLRQGLTTAEIAGHLFVSQVTVRTHVASILKKLSVPDRAAAIRLVDERWNGRGETQ